MKGDVVWLVISDCGDYECFEGNGLKVTGGKDDVERENYRNSRTAKKTDWMDGWMDEAVNWYNRKRRQDVSLIYLFSNGRNNGGKQYSGLRNVLLAGQF